MSSPNAKDFAVEKVNTIKQLCDDLKYTENKELRIFGVEKIKYLANGINEHLEYLDIKENESNE